MRFLTSKRFEKDFAQLPKKVKEKVIRQFTLFTSDPYHKALRNHSLKGSWKNYRSINITADIRAVYKQIDSTTVRFITIGTHAKLYK